MLIISSQEQMTYQVDLIWHH